MKTVLRWIAGVFVFLLVAAGIMALLDEPKESPQDWQFQPPEVLMAKAHLGRAGSPPSYLVARFRSLLDMISKKTGLPRQTVADSTFKTWHTLKTQYRKDEVTLLEFTELAWETVQRFPREKYADILAIVALGIAGQ